MHLVVFGATGNIGRQVVAEALSRGHQVTGVVRDPATTESPDARVRLVQGDATDAHSVADVVRGADAVVSAISPRPNARGMAAPSLAANVHALIAGLREAGVRRVVYVGGAGTLEVAPGQQLLDQPGFPDAYKPEALEGKAALEAWRSSGAGLDWTYVSPAAEIGPGARTGKYRTTDDRFLTDEHGHSRISFADYAVALLDELEQPRHVGKRFGVAY